MRRYSGGFLFTFLFIGLLFAGSSNWQTHYYGRISPQNFSKLFICQQRIDFNNIDSALLNAAIFSETNRQRQERGYPPLEYSPYLEKAAILHSEMMALFDFYSHQNFPNSQKGIVDRLAKVGVTSGMMGENLADVFAIEYEPGRVVYTPDQNESGCFSYELDGAPIQSYSYIDFARMVVNIWMNSDAHRDNILCEHYKFMGVGVSHYRNSEKYYIDQFKVTQNFSSMYGGRYEPAQPAH